MLISSPGVDQIHLLKHDSSFGFIDMQQMLLRGVSSIGLFAGTFEGFAINGQMRVGIV